MKIFYAILVAFGFLGMSCTKFDNKPPVVEELSLEGKTEDLVLFAGQGYAGRYRVTDNKKLSFLQLNVKKGFALEQNVLSHPGDYYFASGYDPDNDVKEEGVALDINANAVAGTYRLTLTARDPNNNVATEKSLDLIILNPGRAPQITANVLTNGDSIAPVYNAKRGDRIHFYGTASDNIDITRIKADMISDRASLFSVIENFPGTDDKTVDLKTLSDKMSILIPPTAERGLYRFILSVTSKTGHTTPMIFKVSVDY